MEKKQERLLLRIEKAGARASLRAGHLISREELMEVKIQIIPLALRLAIAALGAGSAICSYILFSAGDADGGFGFAALSLLLLLFSAFGIRRTLSKILDGLDAASSVELVEAAYEGISALVGAIFDGV